MNNFSLNDKLPIYCIFIFFLLIFVDDVKNIFPCRLRYAFENNIVLKHLMGYLTITFLVVLLEEKTHKNLTRIFTISLYLYILFIFISKTEYGFFVPILVIISIIYVLYLKREEIHDQIKSSSSKEEKEKLENNLNMIININNTLIIFVLVLTFVGFLVYMGRKKFEYKNKFNYLTFIFGKIECKETFNKINFKNSLKYLFL